MDISEAMVRHYLTCITVNWFNDHDLPPDNVGDCRPFVESMKTWAVDRGDLPALKLASEHLLGHPEVDCGPLGDVRYPFENEDIRVIIASAWRTLRPGTLPIPKGGPPGVKLARMPLEEGGNARSARHVASRHR